MVDSRSATSFGARFIRADAAARSARRSRSAVLGLLLASASTAVTPAFAVPYDVAGVSQMLSGVAGSNGVTNSGSAATLTIDVSSGNIFSLSGIVNGLAGSSLKIVKDGAGEQDFNGHNTYDGGTDILAGVLGFGAFDSLGSGVITIKGNGTAVLLATGTNTVLNNDIVLSSDGSINSSAHSPVFDSLISGTGILTKLGGGSIQINNTSNSYGGTVLAQGTILLGHSNVLGLGTLTVTGAATLSATSSQSLNNAVDLAGGSLTVGNAGTTLELDGIVSGANGINVFDGAELILKQANTYNDVTQLTGSTVGIWDGHSLGNNAVISADGILKAYGDNLTVDNTVRINNTFTVNTNNNTLTLSGGLNDTNINIHGSLNVVGGGTLILTHASNGYTLGTTVTGAALEVSSNAQLGSGTAGVELASGALIIDGTAFTSTSRVLTLTGSNNAVVVTDALGNVSLGLVTGGGDLHKEGLGAINLTGTNSQGNTFVGNGTINFDSSGAFGTTGTIILQNGNIVTATDGLTLTNNIALVGTGEIQTGSANLTFDGVIYSSGKLVKSGSGAFNLDSTNSYSGGTHVIGGTVRVGANDALGVTTGKIKTALFESGTTLAAGADAALSNRFSFNGIINVDAEGHTLTLSGPIDGAGQFHKVGSGTVILSGLNTYTNGTGVNDGTLRVDSSTGTGATSINSGARLQGIGSLAATTTIFSGGTLAPGNSAGTITFDYLTMNAGSVVEFELGAPGNPGLGVSDFIVVTHNLALDATFNFTNLGGLAAGTYHLISYGGSYTGNPLRGTVPSGFGGYQIVAGGGFVDLIVSPFAVGPQYWDGGNVVGDNVVNGGTGTWNTVGQNWTAWDGSANSSWASDTGVFAGVAGTVTVAGTQHFDTLKFDIDDYQLTGGTLQANATGTFDVTYEGDTASVVSTITGSGGLVKEGLGTLSLGGNNIFTGGVYVHEGILDVASSGALGGNLLTLSATTGLKLSSSFANDIVVEGVGGSGATFDTTLSNITLSGVISGTGSITKTGTAALSLSGNNVDFSGGINLTQGQLNLLSSNAAGTGPITTTGSIISFAAGINNGAAIIVDSDSTELFVLAGTSATQSGAISELHGPRTLFKIGGGNLTLTGINTLTGGIALNAGKLTVAGGDNLGTGELGAADGTTLAVGTSGNQAITIANDIALSGALHIGLAGTSATQFDAATGMLVSNGNNVTLSGRITGTGSLVADSSIGNLIIPGNSAGGPNTYSGGTTLGFAIASVGADGALGTGTIKLENVGGIVNNSGHAVTLDNTVNFVAGQNSLGGSSDLTLSGALTGSTSLATKFGNGTLALTNMASDVTGDILVSGGTLQVDGALTNTALTVGVLNGGTLGGIGSIAGHVTIATGGILAPGDSPGTLTIGSLDLLSGSIVNQQLGEANIAGGSWNDLTVVTGKLVIENGVQLNLFDSHAFGVGVYNIFTYGTLDDQGLSVGIVPAGYLGTIQELIPGQINLLITNLGDLIQYWDGTDAGGNGIVDGGSGTWSSLNTNWTSDPFGLNTTWQNTVGVFAGTAGTVNLTDDANFSQLQFAVDGYKITADAGVGLVVTPGDIIQTGVGVNATIAASISGAGSIIKQGAGNLVLDGDNSYTGDTLLTGGTITVGTNTALGVGGTLVMSDQTTLAVDTGGLVLVNDITTLGAAHISSGSASLQLDGKIGGAGSVIKDGSGNLILNGLNDFAGGLTINVGKVTIGNSEAAGPGTITMETGTHLVAGTSGLVLGNHFEIAAGIGYIDASAGVLTINGTIAGAGALGKEDTGELILNGINSFHVLAIYQGKVTLGNADAAGVGYIGMLHDTILAAGVSGLTLTNDIGTIGNASIDSGAGELTLNGLMYGSESFAQIGTGNLIINGNNTFAGGLTIAHGTVTLGTSTAAGTGTLTIADGSTLAAGAADLIVANAVVTAGAGIVDTKALSFTLGGAITGLGSIVKVGTGNLILNGSNSFAGGLGITAGMATLGTNTAAGTGVITIAGGSTLKAGLTGLVVANDIDTLGAGRIDTGTGSFSLTGHIVDVGGITKVGTGILLLTNTSSYAGGTTVAAGRLNVTGALTNSTVTVASAATLGGTGSVNGLVVQAGGTVAPGMSVGTLTVTGNASFAATSNYALEILGVTSDKIVVTGAAALGGANVVVSGGLTAPNIFGTSYQILTAAGGRTGNFALTPGGFSQAFKPGLVYSANDVKLVLAPASIVGLLGSAGARSSNITNVAVAIDTSVAAGFNPQNFFNIFLQNPTGVAASLNQLTGEITSANSRTAMADSRYVREAALDRLGASLGGTGGGTNGVNTSGTDEHEVSVWARALGAWTTSNGDGNGSHLSIDAKGVITGIDASFGDWKVGGLFNYIESDVQTPNLGKGKVKSTGGAVYAGYRADKGFAFGIGGAASHVRSTESRTVSFPATTQPLTGRTSGTSYQGFGDLSYDLAKASNTRIEPFFRAAYVDYKVDGFAEAGGFAGLNVAKGKYDTTYLTAGLRGSFLMGSAAWFRASAGYQRTSGDRTPVSLVTLQGTSAPAAIRGVALDKSAFAGEVGIDARLGRNITLGAGYSGVLGKDTKDNGVKATLTVGF